MSQQLQERMLEWADPERVYLAAFADASPAIWLDSGPESSSGATATGIRGMSVMGVPRRVVSVTDPAEALHTLSELLASTPRIRPRSLPTPLGWVGWVGYEVGASEMGTPAHLSDTPAMMLGYLERAVVFDHGARRVRLLALGDATETRDWLDRLTAELAQISSLPIEQTPASTSRPGPVRWRHGREHYLDLIRECQRLIGEGDSYQVCLCNEAAVSGEIDPVNVHRRLRRRSPTHHGGLFRAGDFALVCGSPEQFLTVDATRHVVTRPMKGTRPRADGSAADADLAHQLHHSEKERAENVMIVDLMRNDLSRVSEVGSVEVTELFGVEHYATVHQLVSTVESSLDPGRSIGELIQATLPPGSMTGAPKHSAMTAIDRLEDGPRGVFSGVFGRISIDGTVDLAVVIRSVVISPGLATVGAGGGITALSVPDEEYAETMLKAESMLWALGADG